MRGSETPRGEGAGAEECNGAPDSGGRHGDHSDLSIQLQCPQRLKKEALILCLSLSRTPGIPEKEPHFSGVGRQFCCFDVISHFLFYNIQHQRLQTLPPSQNAIHPWSKNCVQGSHDASKLRSY
jgi:hypothetical protein